MFFVTKYCIITQITRRCLPLTAFGIEANKVWDLSPNTTRKEMINLNGINMAGAIQTQQQKV